MNLYKLRAVYEYVISAESADEALECAKREKFIKNIHMSPWGLESPKVTIEIILDEKDLPKGWEDVWPYGPVMCRFSLVNHATCGNNLHHGKHPDTSENPRM